MLFQFMKNNSYSIKVKKHVLKYIKKIVQTNLRLTRNRFKK